MNKRKKYLLIIPDGAADLYRLRGRSPIALAGAEYMDFVAREGVTGLMQTLYSDLPKGSIVAQLGMLGWDPHLYYPNGRASFELLALNDIHLDAGDLAFRANLVRMKGNRLKSYNADYILSEHSLPLVERINAALRADFPDFELHHNDDFRNTLVVRGAGIEPSLLRCPEPHESHDFEFDISQLISAIDDNGRAVAQRINQYLVRARQLLRGGVANMLFPWSASKNINLPSFHSNTRFDGKAGMVGHMDFLKGIAKAGGIDFFKVGNGRPDTDYQAKGAAIINLFSSGYEFVVCHINSPDEASHMGDAELKVECIKKINDFVVRPAVEYFCRNGNLGGLVIAPDHYTNVPAKSERLKRAEVHSAHPVPFALWNGRERDEVRHYSEDDALRGKYGKEPINHLDLLSVMGVSCSLQTATAAGSMDAAIASHAV
jgi:2,3-bisphosphoglycerate-independent phosphoglycerate mutase